MQGEIELAGFPLFVPRCNICQQPISDKGLYIRQAKIKNNAVSRSGEQISSQEGRSTR